MKRLRIFGFVLFGILILCPSPALSHTATQFFDVKIINLPSKGSAKQVTGRLLLRNLFKKQFVVNLVHSFQFSQGNKARNKEFVRVKAGKIPPGGQLQVPFKFQLMGDGKYQVLLYLEIEGQSGANIGRQSVDLYFKVRKGQYQRTTYNNLYLPRLKPSRKGDPPNVVSGTGKPRPNDILIPHPEEAKAVLGVNRLKPKQLPPPRGSGGPKIRTPFAPKLPKTFQRKPQRFFPKKRSEIVPSIPSSQNRELHASVEHGQTSTPKARWSDSLSELFSVSEAEAQAPQTYTVSGKFSYRGLDNNLHPGWNWLVRLWWRTPTGNWVILGSRYIPSSGNWSLSVAFPGYSGQHLRIMYRAGSYFIMPQDQNNNEYWWRDTDQTNIPTNFNIGHRVANTSTSGTVAGLGDVHNTAYVYWNKFTINGLNPERSQAIRLFFPNTWYDCGAGTGNPWSCASTGGDIWLIAAHTDRFTTQHELAHQTNNEFWNNQRPPGAGGAHTLDDCYNTGLALREGYANAVPHWVLDGENSNDPNAAGFELESPDKDDICNGDTNETWVAGTFWDLLDRHSDDKDVLYFNNAVEVFSRYLNAGVKNGIKNYQQTYRNAASQGHQQYIDDIYKNNTIQ